MHKLAESSSSNFLRLHIDFSYKNLSIEDFLINIIYGPENKGIHNKLTFMLSTNLNILTLFCYCPFATQKQNLNIQYS